jgi:DNA repair protein RadC
MKENAALTETKKEPHYTGHRERLKKKCRASGRKALADYEILELLLGYAIPRKDVKELAKSLIDQFGSFKKVFDEPVENLEKVKGLGGHSALMIKLVKECMVQYLEPDTSEKITLSSPEAVSDFLQKNISLFSEDDLHNYLRAELGNQQREFFMVLCLNSGNQLIHKQVMFAGTIDQAQVYPREILKIALLKNAASIILVHNHPSGNSKPSEDDIALTRRLESISKEFGLRIHDHIVVSGDHAFSIRANRLLN